MSIFDIFKRKKAPAKSPADIQAGRERKTEKKAPVVAKVLAGKGKKTSSIAYKVLVSPHVTEKATELGEGNKYVFKVWPNANKIEIKKGVESLYGIDVVGVNIINIHRKKRRVGRRREGWKKGYKKAIVEIKKGQKIEIMPR
jgi:large subunit ribosomal protein L23